jgi:sulfur carrier protein
LISLTVNGAPRELPEVRTVAELISAMQLTGKRIAVERNGAIVPRSRYGDETLASGDQLEVVVAVGGG